MDMKWFFCCAAGLVATALTMSLCSSARAGDLSLEVGGGYIQTQTPEDGMWYQESFDHELDLNSPTYRVGLRYGNWVLGYRDLGNFGSTALAVSDHAYNNNLEEEPLMYRTKGKVTGTYLSRDFNLGKNFYLTAGAWYERSHLNILEWQSISDKPISKRNDELTWFGGFGYKTGKMRVWLEAWEIHGPEGWHPVFKGVSTNVGVSVTF